MSAGRDESIFAGMSDAHIAHAVRMAEQHYRSIGRDPAVCDVALCVLRDWEPPNSETSPEAVWQEVRAALAARQPVGQEPVAEVIQNPTLHVYIDWRGKTILDYVGAKLYAAPPAQADQQAAAYQRRDSLHPHCEGWTDWRQTDKAEFDRLNKLRAEQPAFFAHVETRALYAAPVDLAAVIASLRKAEALLAKSDKFNRDVVLGRAIAPFVDALTGSEGVRNG